MSHEGTEVSVHLPDPIRPDVTTRESRARSLAQAPAVWSIVFGLILGSVVIASTGNDPVTALGALVRGAFAGRNFQTTLNIAVPIVGMAIAAAVALRAGAINLGGEGQLVMGGMAAAVVAVVLPTAGPVTMVLAILAGMAVGALLALGAALLEVAVGVPLLLSTLLLNYPARGICSYLARQTFADAESGAVQTALVPPTARIPYLLPSFRVNAGIVLIVIIALLVYIITTRTSIGLSSIMMGRNAKFATYTGVDRGRTTLTAMTASGAIAGLVGALVILGYQYRFIDGALTTPQYAWVGLMAALLAGAVPLGTVAAAFFFTVLQVGGLGMERTTAVSRDVSQVIQAVIIVFLAARIRPSFKSFARRKRS